MPAWIAVATALITQVGGTPYVSGGDSPAGTDCSGIVSWVANIASGRPAFGDRFSTANEETALRDRGFVDGEDPGQLNVGFNAEHTALTLPDGTDVESGSGDGGGVEINHRGGAFQRQFDHHMFLPGSGGE
jgi:cell wall-associated NlpC family hydrolase